MTTAKKTGLVVLYDHSDPKKNMLGPYFEEPAHTIEVNAWLDSIQEGLLQILRIAQTTGLYVYEYSDYLNQMENYIDKTKKNDGKNGCDGTDNEIIQQLLITKSVKLLYLKLVHCFYYFITWCEYLTKPQKFENIIDFFRTDPACRDILRYLFIWKMSHGNLWDIDPYLFRTRVIKMGRSMISRIPFYAIWNSTDNKSIEHSEDIIDNHPEIDIVDKMYDIHIYLCDSQLVNESPDPPPSTPNQGEEEGAGEEEKTEEPKASVGEIQVE